MVTTLLLKVVGSSLIHPWYFAWEHEVSFLSAALNTRMTWESSYVSSRSLRVHRECFGRPERVRAKVSFTGAEEARNE